MCDIEFNTVKCQERKSERERFLLILDGVHSQESLNSKKIETSEGKEKDCHCLIFVGLKMSPESPSEKPKKACFERGK